MFAWRAFPSRGDTPLGPAGYESDPAGSGAYLTVPALEDAGIRVAFTTRLGGSSAPPFASLNLAWGDDDQASVEANRSVATAAVGASPRAWTAAEQVHGAGVARVGEAERGADARPGSAVAGVDALWTDQRGVALATRVADCVPVLLADPRRSRIGVVHAGWRGLVAGVIEETVRAMEVADGLTACIGPSIGPCCYEVGDDVAGPARERFGDDVIREGWHDLPHVDLWRAALIALDRAGVRDVAVGALCTKCESHRFFSHRAGDGGRQALVAVLDHAI